MRKYIYIFSALLSVNLMAIAPSNKYFDFSYTDTQDSGDLNGFSFRLGLELSDSIYFDTSRYKLEGSGFAGNPELDIKNYAFGMKFDVTYDTFFYVDYSNLKLTDETNNSDKGHVQAAGLRGAFSRSFEWQLEYNRTKLDGTNETSTGNLVGLHYVLSSGAIVFVEKLDWLDRDIATIGFRFGF